MKIFSLAFACMVGMAASAQDTQDFIRTNKLLILKKDTVPGRMPNAFARPMRKSVPAVKPLPKGSLIGTSRYGAVYALPQDQMPCIVPDMPGEPQIPNPGRLLLKKPIDPGISPAPRQPFDS